MSDTATEQTPKSAPSTPNTGLSDKPDWNAIWKRAEAKAEQFEAYQRGDVPKAAPKKRAPKPKVEAKPDTDKVDETSESEGEEVKAAPTPKAKAPTEKAAPKTKPEVEAEEPEPTIKAKPAPVAKASEASEVEADDEPTERVTRTRADKERELQSLAKELGLRVEGAAVSTEERVGFRAEKRKWHEKMEAKERAFEQKLDAVQNYFAPMAEAKKLIDQGDYDAALKALGLEDGLSGATRLHLERESGKDPKVRELEKQVEQMRKEQEARIRQEREHLAAVERERAIKDSLRNISTRLSSHPEYGKLAQNEWLMRGVLQVMDENYDGIDTLSPEEALMEKIHLLRTDARAKQVYEALHYGVFGSRGPDPEPESDEDDSDVDRSDPPPSAKPGKKLPKVLSKREAAEALAPQKGPISEQEWVKRHAARMAQARDNQ